MTSETDLLPMPKPLPRVLVHVLHEGDMELEAVGNYYAAEQVRACVSSATAARDAEVEALRAEVARLKALVRSVGYETLDRAEKAEARAERLAEALREVVELRDLLVPDTSLRDEEWEQLDRCVRAARSALDQEKGRG